MNQRQCRRHLWLSETCALCGAADPHKHCYSDWHACAWYGPLEHDRERQATR